MHSIKVRRRPQSIPGRRVDHFAPYGRWFFKPYRRPEQKMLFDHGADYCTAQYKAERHYNIDLNTHSLSKEWRHRYLEWRKQRSSSPLQGILAEGPSRVTKEAGGTVIKADYSDCWDDEELRKSLLSDHPDQSSNLVIVAQRRTAELERQG